MSAEAMPSSSSGSYRGGRGACAGPGPGLAPVEVPDDVAADAQRVGLVEGEVVGEPGGARVHLRAAEGLVVGILVDRHLHERRAAEVHPGGVLLQHDVVAHARHVGAARRRRAEHQRDRRDAGRGQPGEVLEGRAAGDEDVRLLGEVGPAGLGEGHERQAVLAGDLHGAQGLGHGDGRLRAALHRRVVRAHHALDAVDAADAGDQARADGVVGAPAGQRGELEEGRAAVEQEADALAGQELAARPVPGNRSGVLVGVRRAAAGGQLPVQGVDLGQGGQQRLAVGGEELRARVDVRPQGRGHESDASVKLIRASISLARVPSCPIRPAPPPVPTRRAVS